MSDINRLERALKQKIDESSKLTEQVRGLLAECERSMNSEREAKSALSSAQESAREFQIKVSLLEKRVSVQQQSISDLSRKLLEAQAVTKWDLEREKEKEELIKLQSECQWLRRQLSLQESKSSEQPIKIEYIKQHDCEWLVNEYERMSQQEKLEKTNLNNEIVKLTAEVERLRFESTKTQEMHRVAQMKLETEKQLLQSKLQETNEQFNELQQERQLSAKKNVELETERDRNAQIQQSVLIEKDTLIDQLTKEIDSLKKRMHQSRTFVVDALQSVMPTHLDEHLRLKKESLLQTRELERLKILKKELEAKYDQLQKSIDLKFPIVRQRQKDYEQLVSSSHTLKSKLEHELKNNLQLRNQLAETQHHDLKQRRCIEVLTEENQKLITENSELIAKICRDEWLTVDQLNQERLRLQKEVIEFKQTHLQDIQLSIPAQQLEALQQQHLQVQQQLTESQVLVEQLNQQIHDLETQKIQEQQPITHKIQKIKVPKEKDRSLILQNRKLSQELANVKFELTKLEGKCEFEQKQRFFLENSIQKTVADNKAVHNKLMEQHQEFQKQLNLILSQPKQTDTHTPLLIQNKKLYEALEQAQEEIQNLQKREKQVIIQMPPSDSEFQIQQVQLKIQIENQNILLQSYEQQLLKNQQEVREEVLPNLNQLATEIANQRREIQFESVADYKEALNNIQKQFQEQSQKYQDIIQKLKDKIQAFSKALSDNEVTHQELRNQLAKYQRLYEEQIEQQQYKQTLSKEEYKEMQGHIDQLTQDRNTLQRKLDHYSIQQQDHANKMQDIQTAQNQLAAQKQQLDIHQAEVEQKLQSKFEEIQNQESLLILNEHILQRQVTELQGLLQEEQMKVNNLLKQGDMDLEPDLNLKQNELVELQYEIDKARIEKLKMRVEQPQIQFDFEEERRHYQYQIEQLKEIREGITLDDIALVKAVVQDGRLVKYLERAKSIYEKHQQAIIQE